MAGSKDQINYASLINRKVSVFACVMGLLEILVATFTVVCAFIMFGGFCENLDCSGISKGVGFWLGFPLMIPGIMGLVVMGTRHIRALYVFGLTNVLVLIFAIVHTILVYNDYNDFWKKQKDLYNANKCSILGANKCECVGTTTVYPYQCDLIEFGYDLNWILFGLSIAAMVTCVFSIMSTIVGRAITEVTPQKYRT